MLVDIIIIIYFLIVLFIALYFIAVHTIPDTICWYKAGCQKKNCICRNYCHRRALSDEEVEFLKRYLAELDEKEKSSNK